MAIALTPQTTWFSGGINAAGGSLYVYQTGTTTLVTVYADGALSIPISNPITLDANGNASFYVGALVNLKLQIYSATGVLIETLDPVYPYIPNVNSTPQSISAYYVTATGGNTSRTLANLFADIINVLNFGADPTGITDSTLAIKNAITYANSIGGGIVFFPQGNYSVSPSALSNIKYVTLSGVNKYASILSLSSTGTLLDFSNCQWMKLEKLGFQASGLPQNLANAYGVQFDTGSGNNQIEDCLFQGFSKDGLRIIGTSGTPLSGHEVNNCYFLGNGGKQLYGQYCNDFHIQDNQYGSLSGITHASYGCYLDTCLAGVYKGNMHWSNNQGFYATNCSYNTYSLNRFEMSDQQNVYITGGTANIFTSNKCHTASQSSSGSYDNVYITSVATMVIADNALFSWTGTSQWGINIDTGCTDVTVGKNKISGYSASFGPIRVNGTVGSQVSGDFHINGSTGAASAANQTTYIGAQINTFTEALATFNVPKKCQFMRLWVAVDTAPGAGQSFTYNLRKNATSTGLSVTISGASTFNGITNTPAPGILFAPDDAVSLQLVTSATAAAANHRFYVEFVEY